MLTFHTLWPIYPQTNFLSPTRINLYFQKLLESFVRETYNFVMCLHKLLFEKIKEKVPGKVGECIFDSKKCKSFQGPKAGPGPPPIYTRSPALSAVGNFRKKILGPPPLPVLDPLLLMVVRGLKNWQNGVKNCRHPHLWHGCYQEAS